MTRLMEKAIDELRRLPVDQQDAMASLILDQIADDQQWDEQFAKAPAKLASLVKKARDDIRAGRVVDKGMDEI